MKGIIMRLLAVMLSLFIGISSNLFWVKLEKLDGYEISQFIDGLFNFPGKVIPLEYKKKLFEHPLSFRPSFHACGFDGSSHGYKCSDGETIVYSMLGSETPELTKQKLDDYLKNAYQILEQKQVVNPSGQNGSKIIATFRTKDQENVRVSIITAYSTSITVIDAPTLFHANEFEHCFSS
jgi:hypothetical protein